MDSGTTIPLKMWIRLLSSSLRQPTDGERVDAWAVCTAQWRRSLPDLCAPVHSLPGYIECGVFLTSTHCLEEQHCPSVRHLGRGLNPMPFSVYQKLARQEICGSEFCTNAQRSLT